MEIIKKPPMFDGKSRVIYGQISGVFLMIIKGFDQQLYIITNHLVMVVYKPLYDIWISHEGILLLQGTVIVCG